MTQVSRYGHMLKVTVTGMRMRVRARYRVTGSVLHDNVMAEMVGAETMQALLKPVPITGQTILNGQALAAE